MARGGPSASRIVGREATWIYMYAAEIRRVIVRGYFQAHGEQNCDKAAVFDRPSFMDIFLPVLGLVGVQQGFARLFFFGCTLAQGHI